MKTNNNIIAHRGIFDNITTPENSLLAFKKALKNNINIELDVQLTKDNILVVFHDPNLIRMTSKDINLQNTNYKDIKNIKLLNTKETIPTLKEVLELINDKVLLDIEIKDTKRIKETCNILMNELSKYNNYVLKSFNPRIVKYLKKHYKDKKVGLLLQSKYKNKLYNYISKTNLLLFYCHPDFIAISKKLLNTKRINKLKEKIPIMVWTIKDKEEIIDKNITYICNNLPYKK